MLIKNIVNRLPPPLAIPERKQLFFLSGTYYLLHFLSEIINLRIYCTEHGMTLAEFRQYAKDHTLEKKLESTSKLREMSPEKLKAYLEKI